MGQTETSACEPHSENTSSLSAETDLGVMPGPTLQPPLPHLSDGDNGTSAYAIAEALSEILAGKPLAQGLAHRKHH